MTLELGLIRTCLLPAFSALLMLLSASFRTLVLTILAAVGLRFSNRWEGYEVSIEHSEQFALAFRSLEHEECPLECILGGFLSSVARRDAYHPRSMRFRCGVIAPSSPLKDTQVIGS